MRLIARVGLGLATCFALGGSARAADETATANVTGGGGAASIASAFAAAWSQAGNYACSSSGNRIVIQDLSGDCNEPASDYTFVVQGGTLNQNHVIKLRIQCASPTMASMEFDGGGFTLLVPGPNVFVAGSDTITVFFRLRPCGGGGFACPALSSQGLAALVGLVLVAGVVLLQRRPAAA